MTTEEFRAALATLNMTQKGLAEVLASLGDTGAPITILRRVERWAQGGSAVPGEAAALLNLLTRFPKVLDSLQHTKDKEPT